MVQTIRSGSHLCDVQRQDRDVGICGAATWENSDAMSRALAGERCRHSAARDIATALYHYGAHSRLGRNIEVRDNDPRHLRYDAAQLGRWLATDDGSRTSDPDTARCRGGLVRATADPPGGFPIECKSFMFNGVRAWCCFEPITEIEATSAPKLTTTCNGGALPPRALDAPCSTTPVTVAVV